MHIHRISNVNNRTTFRLSRFVKYEKSWFYLKTTNTGIGIPRILTFRSKHPKRRIILLALVSRKPMLSLVDSSTKACGRKKKRKRGVASSRYRRHRLSQIFTILGWRDTRWRLLGKLGRFHEFTSRFFVSRASWVLPSGYVFQSYFHSHEQIYPS